MKIIKPAIMVLALLTISCNEYAFDDVGVQGNSSFEMKSNDDMVSVDDISRIAMKFTSQDNVGSKTRSSRFYTSIVYDESGIPAIYVINYINNEGFILVSATKKQNPILAYSDKGNFDVYGNMPGGLIEWRARAVSGVQTARELPEDSVIVSRMMWHKYENPQMPTFSESSVSSDPFTEESKRNARKIMMDTVASLSSKGYLISSWNKGDEEYDSEAEFVKGSIYPLFQDEWEEFAIKIRGNYYEEKIVPNFVQSTWGQGYGYNQSFPKIESTGNLAVAGCGPVAVGQVMRYYEYPASFNWANMPYNYGTKTTSDLLYDIAVKSKAEFTENGTETVLDNTGSAMRNYGYSTSIYNHSSSLVWDWIKNLQPVIMRANPKGDTGHAWVASGGKYIYKYYIESKILAFTDRTVLRSIRSKESSHNSIYYFYMNWGWNGSYDGYYLDSDLKLNYSTAELENRRNLYIYKPNK